MTVQSEVSHTHHRPDLSRPFLDPPLVNSLPHFPLKHETNTSFILFLARPAGRNFNITQWIYLNIFCDLMPINTSTLPVQCAITKHMCVFFFFKYQKTNLKKKIYTQKVTNVFLISIKFNTTKNPPRYDKLPLNHLYWLQTMQF